MNQMIATAILLFFFLLCQVYPLQISKLFTHPQFSSCLHTTLSQVDPEINQLIIRSCLNKEIPNVANFLGQFWFSTEISKAQRLEFTRLEVNDLSKRYGERVGQRKFKATLLLALENDEILGCVGLDCQKLDLDARKFATIYDSTSVTPGEDIVTVVLANLVIRKDRRKQGIAQKLLSECETVVKGWGYNDIHLLVDSENKPAQRLYSKQGYKLIFRDEDASCVMPGAYNLRTAPCTNLCYKKSLKPPTASSPFNWLSTLLKF